MKQKKIEIRKVNISEISDVYALYCEEENIKTIKKVDLKKAKKIYAQMLKKGCYTLGAFDSDCLVGVVSVYKNMQYYPLNLENPFVHLECVIIKRGYQNKGIGTSLLVDAVKTVKQEGCTYIIGQSDEHNMQKVFYKSGLTNTKYKDFRFETF